MPTDTDKKLNGTPEPFRRPVVWGRPPATIFRAGPLPKGDGLPPLPEAPPMQFTPGILSGSMIPRAAPTRPPVAPSASPPHPDLTVRPLPTVAPAPAPEPAAKPAPEPVPEPVQAIAFSEHPATTHPPVATSPGRTGRIPLYAGIAAAAAVVLALGGWIWMRSADGPPAPAVEPVPAPTVVPVAEPALPESPVETAPEAASEPVDATAAPAVSPPPAAVNPARATPVPAPRPVNPAPAAASPAAVTPAPAASPPPVVVVAPAPGPEPTAAEPASTDPDAPIATRPQPIG